VSIFVFVISIPRLVVRDFLGSCVSVVDLLNMTKLRLVAVHLSILILVSHPAPPAPRALYTIELVQVAQLRYLPCLV